MKNYTKIISGLFILLLITADIRAQESDYKIKSDFEIKYQSIENALKNAINSSTIDSLKKEILFLDDEYSDHIELLDNALFPKTYSDVLFDLQTTANISIQRLLIIENQNERLSFLNGQIGYYKSEITFLNKRSDSLYNAIENSQANEERLTGLLKRYRENLELRDELIMDVVDSLMISYSGMTTKKVNEIAEKVNSGTISGNNPLEMLENILKENIEYVTNNNQALSVEDHLRMYAVQHHFEDVWKTIGEKMVIAYGGAEKKEWNQEINSKIKEWRMVTSQKMWKSMDEYLEFSNVDLGAFDNNYSFFIALDNFIKEAQRKSEDEIISSESFNDYKKFQEFWSGKIKNDWSNLVQDTEMLTVSQISLIDDQLNIWETESRPIHPLIIIFIVLTVVSIGGYILVLVKSKKV